jgi:ParB/RepB/Spo0J family partition protein
MDTKRQPQKHLLRDLEVRMLPLAKLKPWKENPRENSGAVEALRKSIQSYGFNVPIICDRRLRILAGHTRRKAAQKLGMRNVPVITVDLDGTEGEAFALADNQTASIASWDMGGLARVLGRLETSGHDLSSIGFSEQQLDALLTPRKEFPWEQFERDQDQENTRPYALLPVKVPRNSVNAVKQAIKRVASRKGLRNKDSAVLAGEVLVAILERRKQT